jgi:hypothetical protein
MGALDEAIAAALKAKEMKGPAMENRKPTLMEALAGMQAEAELVQPDAAQVTPTPAAASAIQKVAQSPALAMDDVEKALRRKELQSLDIQKSGLDQLAAFKDKAMKQPVQMDLSPLMALTDSWTGSELQKGYSKPFGPQDAMAFGQKVEEALQKAKNDFSDKELELLRNQSNRMRDRALDEREGRARRNFLKATETQLINAGSKIQKEASTAKRDFDTMDAAFARGDMHAVLANLGKFSRSIGGAVGAQSDRDIANALPPTFEGGVSRLWTWLDSNPGKVPEGMQHSLRGLVENAKKYSKDYFDEQTTSLEANYAGSDSYGELFEKGRTGANVVGRTREIVGAFGSPNAASKPDVLEELAKKFLESEAKK